MTEISVWLMIVIISPAPGTVSTIQVDNLATRSECMVLSAKLQNRHRTLTADCYEVKKVMK
jgi:hypothetical protein